MKIQFTEYEFLKFYIKNKFMDHLLSVSFALVFSRCCCSIIFTIEMEMKEKTDFLLKGVIGAYSRISALSS